jgi:hypothetical protein
MLSHNFTQRVTDANHIYAVYYRSASRRPRASSATTDSQIRITNEGPQARNITPLKSPYCSAPLRGTEKPSQ